MKPVQLQKQTKSRRIWSSKSADEAARLIRDGNIVDNPFVNNDAHWRKADIIFDYTQEEMEEIKRCASDAVYFANKYAYSMTDDGIAKITLRDYQEEALGHLQENRFTIWRASRQIGKCFLNNIDIYVNHDNKFYAIPFFELFYQNLNRKLTFIEHIKRNLWKLYNKMNKQSRLQALQLISKKSQIPIQNWILV